MCTVVDGDEPLTIAWSLHGEDISSGPDLTTSQLGSRTSILMISSVSYRHSGKYTCTASNSAGSASYSAMLQVNGTSTYIPVIFYGRHWLYSMMTILYFWSLV